VESSPVFAFALLSVISRRALRAGGPDVIVNCLSGLIIGRGARKVVAVAIQSNSSSADKYAGIGAAHRAVRSTMRYTSVRGAC
jgi:hypothetical protein